VCKRERELVFGLAFLWQELRDGTVRLEAARDELEAEAEAQAQEKSSEPDRLRAQAADQSRTLEVCLCACINKIAQNRAIRPRNVKRSMLLRLTPLRRDQCLCY